MIVVVRRNNKRKVIKLLSFVILIGIFSGYYFYINQESVQENNTNTTEKIQTQEKKKYNKIVEKNILNEVEKIVDLIGQKYVQDVKIIEENIVVFCLLETNTDALKVRYGSTVLIENTIDEIIVMIDIKDLFRSN